MSVPLRRNGGPRPEGLPNLGNTCYFNSILQALCSVPKFLEFICKQRRLRSDNQLHSLLRSMALGDVIEEGCLGTALNCLGSPFSDIDPKTLSYYQQDVEECLQRMFERLGSS